MEKLLLTVIGLLLLIICALLIKIYFLRKSAREISDAFNDRLTSETNTLIDISTRDPYMRRLAENINVQLRLLRQQRHRFCSGDKELKDAVTNISHDLRTPLTAICGYMELLEKEEKSENAARYLSLIANRVEAMKQLTEELFRYSVIVSTEKMTFENVSVNDVLEESIAAYYGSLISRNIEPEISITEKKIQGLLNREALSRVFSNILSNALKYSDGDLQIVLTENGEVLFSNTASGLNEIQVGRLFDRFFTVESARNSGGLGLAIAKTLVEQMGGSIKAHLENSVLSICVVLPVCQKEQLS